MRPENVFELCCVHTCRGKKSKEITDEDLTAATAELKSMLGKAVKEHCVNWYAHSHCGFMHVLILGALLND